MERVFYLNLSQFYKFFNTLMNSLPVFYLDNIVRKRVNSICDKENTTKGNEDDICPICEEKKVTIMLDCYVSKIK